MQASLFITCYDDTLFPETGRAVVRLLERLGVELTFYPQQTCCGQMPDLVTWISGPSATADIEMTLESRTRNLAD